MTNLSCASGSWRDGLTGDPAGDLKVVSGIPDDATIAALQGAPSVFAPHFGIVCQGMYEIAAKLQKESR
jgi:hypothetical protein